MTALQTSIQVIRGGVPDDRELAALTAVVLALAAGARRRVGPPERPRAGWNRIPPVRFHPAGSWRS
ncbi:acyl-CoA carboxylase subunit epsilon [Saccharothrix sp. 6-C]|uniref:acyl-CoA carboxylase epsilon subunit n=1 Tax=Saccharothrix sp. 6-C TaxID=2781735 RepID=UPI001916E5FE|nr:acyl-CoA carboxylase subunit epsilon [Saccharothrix sp. 6-C]